MVKIPLMLGKKLIGRVSKAVSKSREDIRSFRAEKAAERTDSPFNELNKAQERLETAKDVRNTTKDILGTKYGKDSDVNVEFGKTLDEATKYAEEGGFEVRIVEIDGQSKMLTMDAKSNRINFRLNGGFITAAFGG